MKTCQPTRAMLARFWAEDGVLRARLPKRMTWKRALEYSIAKWVYIQQYLEKRGELIEDGGESTCACCYRAVGGCRSCPIAKSTGRVCCLGTPYNSYHVALDNGNWAAAIDAAEQEVEFLRYVYRMYGEREEE